MIILDNIERLIEYIKIGPRFCNLVLQTLLVYIKKAPPKSNRKLLIIGTTSLVNVLSDLEVVNAFNIKLTTPLLNSAPERLTVLGKYKGDPEERARVYLINIDCSRIKLNIN